MSTPTMTLHLNDEISPEAGRQFAMGISRLSIAEITESLTVKCRLENGRGSPQRMRVYEICLNFYAKKEYEDTYAIKAADVAQALFRGLVPNLHKAIRRDCHFSAQYSSSLPHNRSSSQFRKRFRIILG